MDKATIIGVVGGFFNIALGIYLGGGDPAAYIDAASVVITVVGTLFSTLAANTITTIRGMGRVFKMAFMNKRLDPVEYVVTLVGFAEKARREGLLSLEDEVEAIDDDFLQSGIKLIIDGTEPNAVKTIMNAEMSAVDLRHKSGIKVIDDMGNYFPAYGMIGTLIGLIVMMRSLGGDASAVGKGMAAALITTFYGSVLANVVCIPISGKLARLNDAEVVTKEIILEGILSIQAGDNPRILQKKLLSYFDAKDRGRFDQSGV